LTLKGANIIILKKECAYFVTPSLARKDLNKFGIFLAYSYLSPLEKILPLEGTKKTSFLWFFARLFVPLGAET
jgi:hypothetical protein